MKDEEVKYYKDYIECWAGIAKIKEIFRLGFVPKISQLRYDADYACHLNCFAHAVCSFPPKIMKKINFNGQTDLIFDVIDDYTRPNLTEMEKAFYSRISLFGLEAKPCNINDECDQKSWKVRLYGNEVTGDYHYIKCDEGSYSHKVGFFFQPSQIKLFPDNFKLERVEMQLLYPEEGREFYDLFGKNYCVVDATEGEKGIKIYNKIGDYMLTNPNGKPFSEKLVDKIEKEL